MRDGERQLIMSPLGRWGVFSTSRGSEKENKQPDGSIHDKGSWSADGESVVCTSTCIPTEAGSRRNMLKGNVQGTMARKNRAGGTGRSTHLRSFTLHLTLPIPPPPAPSAPSISPQLAHSYSSFEPHFINAGTPVAGIPEWLPRGALIPRTKTPSVQSLRAPPASVKTPGLQFTPMEGVPERCYPRAQIASRLALLAQYPAQQEPEETLVIHRPNDNILLPDTALDQDREEEGEREEEKEVSVGSMSCHPMVTPFGRHRNIDIQVGQSLGKERVPQPLATFPVLPSAKDNVAVPSVAIALLPPGTSSAPGLLLKTPASTPKESHLLAPPPTRDDDDDNGDMPGCFDDGHCSEEMDQAHDDQEIQPNVGPSLSVPAPSLLNTVGPSDDGARGRQRATTKRPREVLKRETEADRKARKSLAEDGLKVDESDGMRRSSRAHQRPLEYWRNEHKVFGRVHQSELYGSSIDPSPGLPSHPSLLSFTALPTVTRYETRTPNPSWPQSNKGKEGKKRARTRG